MTKTSVPGSFLAVLAFGMLVVPEAGAQLACGRRCEGPAVCVEETSGYWGCRVHCEQGWCTCSEYANCEEMETILDHPLLPSVPERTLRTPTGTIRLVWLAGNRFGTWRSCDGTLSHLVEEQPDGTLRLLDAREFGPLYPYLQWLAVRMGVGPAGDAS